MEMWWLSVPFAVVLCLVLSWLSTGDDDFNIHESTIMRVSLRTCTPSPGLLASGDFPRCDLVSLFFRTGNPVRESGPPACMAKLIMMRHRVRDVHRVQRNTPLTLSLTPDKPGELEEKGWGRIDAKPLAFPIARPQAHPATSPAVPDQVPEPRLVTIQSALGKAVSLTSACHLPLARLVTWWAHGVYMMTYDLV